MFNLPSLLEKFSQLKDPKETKNIITKIISEEIGIDIPISEILIQKDSIVIHSGSVIKNQIFLKKDLIVLKLGEQLPELGIKTIC